MSLAYNGRTNLFILSNRGATLINLGSKSNSVIEVDRAVLQWGSNIITFDHVTLINLYISPVIKKPQGLKITINLFQIFCVNKIQQILPERLMLSW